MFFGGALGVASAASKSVAGESIEVHETAACHAAGYEVVNVDAMFSYIFTVKCLCLTAHNLEALDERAYNV